MCRIAPNGGVTIEPPWGSTMKIETGAKNLMPTTPAGGQENSFAVGGVGKILAYSHILKTLHVRVHTIHLQGLLVLARNVIYILMCSCGIKKGLFCLLLQPKVMNTLTVLILVP